MFLSSLGLEKDFYRQTHSATNVCNFVLSKHKSSSLGIVKNHVIEELNNNFRFHEIFRKNINRVKTELI